MGVQVLVTGPNSYETLHSSAVKFIIDDDTMVLYLYNDEDKLIAAYNGINWVNVVMAEAN